MRLVDRLLGRPLTSSEEGEQKIGVLAGVPSLGLDGLSSAAYGPEAALTLLLPLGILGLNYIGPITVVILVLLFILYLSYRQTITAYPNGGGSYTVAHENLGIKFGLLAAAALMLDYTLTVAVGISAGVGALISAAPSLHRHTLALCLGFLALITLVNLRGAREAGAIFALPTYLFVLSLGGVLVYGIVQALGHGGHPHPVLAPPPVPKAVEAVSLWLLLRAFASGCTAMTGVEAVSNGVTIFAAPVVQNAQRTLTAIVIILLALLAGIAYLCRAYGIAAMDEARPDYQSVISLLLNAVVGRGAIYYVTLGSVLAVLVLSANTSYAGFPRLCRLVALDGYLPRVFALLGRRLVYTVGILFLTGLCAVLLVAFKGITDKLIPLYAVGAFMAFTLSQAGMVMHWRRAAQTGESKNKAGAGGALFINGLGAVCTALALVVILVAKFAEGAWITVPVLVGLMALFFGVRRHYDAIAEQIGHPRPLDLSRNDPPVAVVPLGEWNIVTERALRFGMRPVAGRLRGVCQAAGRERQGRGGREEGAGTAGTVGGAGGQAGPGGGPAPAASGGAVFAVPAGLGAFEVLPRHAEVPIPRPPDRGDHPRACGNALVGLAAAQPPGDRPEGEPAAAGRPAHRRDQRPLVCAVREGGTEGGPA